MVLRITVVVALLIAGVGAGAARAAVYGEGELRSAAIRIDAGRPEGGQTVAVLIDCLAAWNPGDRTAPNEVEIARLGDDTFTVAATLRSRSVFHFQVARESGKLVALLRRVEYIVPNRNAFQQLTDTESKRAVLRSACGKS